MSKKKIDKRFTLVHKEKGHEIGTILIMRDDETGVLYCYTRDSLYATTVTPLLDSNGKPLNSWHDERKK